MRFEITKSRKLLFIITALLAAAFISISLYSPIYISKIEKNWSVELNEKNLHYSSYIQEQFDKKTGQLISTSSNIKREMFNSGEKKNLRTIFTTILNPKYSGYSIQLYQNNKLLAWNSEPVTDSSDLSMMKKEYGQTHFIQKKLFAYLTLSDTILWNKENLLLIVSLPVKKFYQLKFTVNSSPDFVDSLSLQLRTDVQINYSVFSKTLKDGRKYEFPLLNNFNNKIASVSFSKPALNTELNGIKETFTLIQSFLLLLFILLLVISIIKTAGKSKLRTIRFAVITIAVFGFRLSLFLLEIPSAYLRNELTDASNFSSQFAFGMVRSPLEFLLTGITLLIVSYYAYALLLDYFRTIKEEKKSGYIIPVIISFVSLVFILLLWRAFGASVKSVIFDSTIRYFKDFTLTPPPAVYLMCINILILGSIVFLSSMALALIIFSNFSVSTKTSRKRVFYVLFIVIQLAGLVYDAAQHDPQGTHLIRILFFTFLFMSLYQIIFREREFIFKFVLYAVAASIISVSLLTYYNSELERESLKTTAYDLIRMNKDQIQFVVFQTLLQIKSDPGMNEINFIPEEASSEAFIIWSKSLLYREGINSSIELYDTNKKYVGGFTTEENHKLGGLSELLNNNEELKLISQRNIYGNSKKISGYITLKNENTIRGYLFINTFYKEDHYNFSDLPNLLKAERAGVSSALDQESICVYDFHNNTLVNSIGAVNLSKETEYAIVHATYNSINEAWIEIESKEERNLVFALKQFTNDGDKTIAISRARKSFTWDLSDFFKIFFIHTFTIILFTILFMLARLQSLLKKSVAFRTKLITALLFVSIIPLFIIATYIRGLTESKNKELLSTLLAEKGTQISQYLNSYLIESNVDLKNIFEKANADLNIKFSVYDKNNLIYSSFPSFYASGLLDKELSAEAYEKLLVQKMNLFSGSEKIEGNIYSASFHVVDSMGKQLVIEVNELFNPISLPLSSVELDIFLFGIFSFAVVLIILISTILSGQISSPIKKLTTATRAVAIGDYSIEVNVKGKGEVKELADGFNLMVQKVKQSQLEVAQFEREEAWREMAKQVAHEIKNPLTPMKLSIQQLVIAYRDKSPKFDSIFEKVTDTISSQIETLKNIASEFSNFARMPGINIQRINLVESISQSVNLFLDEKINLELVTNKNEIFVNADKDHLKRSLVNLIRNSLQAHANKIDIRINTDDSHCYIRIRDNGDGIDKNTLPSIFNENFTTKKSGMGLGLSMAKKYFESLQGKIEVENTSASGTTFLITIPMA